MEYKLEFKLPDLVWEGLYLTATVKVDASSPGIPILALKKRNDVQGWEVRLRKNSALIFTDLEHGSVEMCPL